MTATETPDEDRLTLEEVEKFLIRHKTLGMDKTKIALYQQLADTMRENECYKIQSKELHSQLKSIVGLERERDRLKAQVEEMAKAAAARRKNV